MDHRSLINRMLKEIPSFARFLTVWEIDQLIARLITKPGIAHRTVGRTFSGEEIIMLEVGSGPRTGMIVGVPHSDEPLGSLVATYFARWLADHPKAEGFGWRWLIIPILEREGMRLNEGWFNNFESFADMAKTYFRQPTEDQYEWTFPIEYKDYEWYHSRPETLAIKKVLEDETPELLFGLHHCGFYDAYYYLSEDLPEVYPALRKLAQDVRIPLSENAPDVPFGKSFAQGFNKMYGLRDYIDYYKKTDPEYLVSLHRGACSDEWYQNEIGGYSFNCEVPMYRTTKLRDRKPSGRQLRVVLEEKYRRHKKMADYTTELLDKLRPFADIADPMLYASAKKHVDNARAALIHEARLLQKAEEREATNAEVFENSAISDMFDLFFMGQVWRVAESICIMGGPLKICRLMDKTDIEIETLAKSVHNRGGFYKIPLRSAVKLQLGSLMVIAKALHEKGT